MHSLFRALCVGIALTGAFAQYNDGYESVNLPTDPVQIRLAYHGPNSMIVSWNTFEQLPNPSVSYGTDPSSLSLTASSSVSITYNTSLTYNNHVTISGLSPYTTYYYLPQYSNATTPYTFTTSRAAGDPTPYTVGVVIDMGTFGALGLSSSTPAGYNPLRPNEQTTIAALSEAINEYEFIVHPGDLAYADAWAKEESSGQIPAGPSLAQYTVVYESILNAFFDELESITSSKAYMVNPGNHEANCDNLGKLACTFGQTNFTGYQNHWRMPSDISNGVGNMWYSYDYGMVHYVHINTETDLGNGLVGPDNVFGGPFGSYANQQVDWMTKDLASVNRTLTPWVVVLGHRPFYVSSASNICQPCITAFETLLYTYNVDIYVNGHSHLYDRTLPIYQNVIDPNRYNNPRAPMYLTNGAGGHFAGLDVASSIQPYTVYNQGLDYSWSTLQFLNRTHMVVNGLWSANNTVYDSVTLYKAHDFSVTSSSSSSSSVPATSSSSLLSSTSSIPATSTTSSMVGLSSGTGTTTSAASQPSYTNFNGLGHLYIYVNGTYMGDIGSAGTWYFFPGQGIATWTAYPAAATPNGFTLYKTGYCFIDSTQSFNCSGTIAQAQVFGQDANGDLLYNGSPAWYASSLASNNAKPTVFATPLPVSMNIVWGNLVATPPSNTFPSSSTAVSTSASVTSTSSVFSSTSSTGPITSSTSSGVSSTSSASSTSSTGPITTSSSSMFSSTSSSVPVSSSSSSSDVSLSTSSFVLSSTSSTASTSISASDSSNPVSSCSTASVVTVTASASTVYISQSASTVTVTASALTSTVTITLSASTLLSTVDISDTIIQISTIYSTLPASTIIVTETASCASSSIPISTLTITLPASTLDIPVPTTIVSTIVTTLYTTIPASTVTTTVSSSSSSSSSTQSVSTQAAPTKCVQDNCLRAIINKSATGLAFCTQYLATPSLATPTYASNCAGATSRVSSACYCAVTSVA